MARGAPGEEVYTPEASALDLPRKIVPRMEPVGLPQAFGNAFEAIDKKYQADSATWAGDQLAQARVNAVNALDAAKQNAPPGDQTGFTQKYLAGFDKDNASLAESAGGNPLARSMVSKGLTDLRQTLQQHTTEWEAQQNVAYRHDSFTQNLQSQLPIVQAHPELADQVGSTLADQARSIGGGNAVMLPLMRTMHAQLSQAAADGYVRQNPQGMLDALKDPENAPPAIKSLLSGLSPEQREALTGHATQKISAGYSDNVVATYRDAGPTAGAAALKAVDTLDQPADVKAQIYADIEKGVAQWHDEARQTHAQAIIGLEEHLASGKATFDDRNTALSLFRSGAMTAQQTGETIGRIEKAQEKMVEDHTNEIFATQAYQAGRGIDPQDKNVKDGIDSLFTTSTRGVPMGSPEWINRAADISAKTGVTPDMAVSWSRTQLISGDPKTAATAANALQRMTDANPRGIPFALDEKTKAMAKIINDAALAGTPPEVAVQHAREVTSLPDAEQKRLSEIYTKKQIAQKSEGDLKTQLKDTSNGFREHFWNGIPDVPPQMTGQFEELRQTYFKLTGGNIDQASKLATQDLKQTWGITQVNGKKEFMQFAPEAMNPGLTTQAVRADLEASAKGHTDDPSKVRLLTIPDTYQSNGQRWGLGVPDKFGAYSALTDERGRVIPYQLPNGQQAFKDGQAKASADGIAKLHAAQEVARAREKNELGEVYAQGRQAGAF